MMLVDVHAHLDMDEFKNDLDKVIKNAEKQDLKIIVANGIDVSSNRQVLKLAKKYDIVKPALGLYPNDAIKMTDVEFNSELKFIEQNKPVAIGEIGLDYKEEVNKERMKACFEKQIKLAKKLNIPVIVHSRKAELDVIDLLESFTYDKVIMHCFSGKKNLVDRVINNKWCFSIPAIILRLNHFQMIVEKTPVTQLLTETDSPFLSPYPNVPRNEPSFVIESLQKIAEIKNMTTEDMANQIFMNFQRLFL